MFHPPHFTISDMRLLGRVGSDHFPISIDLRHAPQQLDEHRVLTQKPGDEEEVTEKVERAVESENMHGEAVENEDPDKADAIKI